MLGHIVGSVVQVTVQTSCDLITYNSYPSLCRGGAIFLHEFIVEPLVDSLVISCVRGRYQQNQEYNLAKIALSAVFSLAAGSAINYFLSERAIENHDSKDHRVEKEVSHNNDFAQIVTDSIISLLGGLAGNWVYEYAFE
jgi:hypothetical protein